MFRILLLSFLIVLCASQQGLNATNKVGIERDEDVKKAPSMSHKAIPIPMEKTKKIEDLKKEIEELKKPENRLNGWKWPNDPSWDGKICTNDSTNDRAADWLKLKISKAIDWDLGQKVLQGWKTPEGVYNPRAKYETEGYVCTDGTAVSLTDKETLLQKIGQNFSKEQVLKTRMPAMA